MKALVVTAGQQVAVHDTAASDSGNLGVGCAPVGLGLSLALPTYYQGVTMVETESYTVDADDHLLLVSATTPTVTLPTLANLISGRVLRVKLISGVLSIVAGANTTIEGAPGVVLSTPFSYLEMVFLQSQWLLLAQTP